MAGDKPTESKGPVEKQTIGAWVVHHGRKTAGTMTGAAEFPALDAAAKAAGLLSQLSATDETTVDKARVQALARAAGLNPKTELPTLLNILKSRRLIDLSEDGSLAVLGLSTHATLQHAADIFFDQDPSPEESAAIELAERSSAAPMPLDSAREYIGDRFKLSRPQTTEFLARAEDMTFVDAEGIGSDKLIFNGNLFRKENITKVNRVLQSLSTDERNHANELNALLDQHGCISTNEAERVLGVELFDKLKAAGMYDINCVSNPSGDSAFVTRPSAFHKFVSPMVDDAFDLAKALVVALTYGMTKSSAGRGRIVMIEALLRKLISGASVGPATAIGEDYRVLEQRGVIQVTPEAGLFRMRLLKRDIGEMALGVLTRGDASPTVVLDRPWPGAMANYVEPERARVSFRKSQSRPSKKMTLDVLDALRTKGGF